ncbi:MAG: hypothetical protein JJU28_13455 [Cyclobacteriaceae bacterium]|nr:hypothetical protein [Cyclobacteriaceae bacterium]
MKVRILVILLSFMAPAIYGTVYANDLGNKKKEIKDISLEHPNYFSENKMGLLEEYISSMEMHGINKTLHPYNSIMIVDMEYGVIAEGTEDNLVINRLMPIAKFLFSKGDTGVYLVGTR